MLRRLAITAACVTALALVGAASAQAATRSFIDGPGDVWTLDESPNTRQPNRDQGDILRTTFTHAQRAVVVRTRFAELNREGQHIIAVTRLRTNTGLVRDVELHSSRRPGTNRWRGKTILRRPDDKIEPCPIAHRIDYAANLAVVRVPRTCLNNPRTVQAKFVAGTIAALRAFVDNPFNHGPSERIPHFTAPVRRG
jgi:hypothetical protein